MFEYNYKVNSLSTYNSYQVVNELDTCKGAM